ncbi:MAG: DUF739 domain-containing protein [Firmicutes bacterium]|nr:DUF739 domain-containing protein [Bacillota bacterium]MDY5856263.1 hypothetical protein [Anaerovoracaceae bacterium]
MVDTSELRCIMAKRNVSGVQLAKALNMAPKTFYSKMKKGVFGSDEIEAMIKVLSIDNPMAVFFAGFE